MRQSYVAIKQGNPSICTQYALNAVQLQSLEPHLLQGVLATLEELCDEDAGANLLLGGLVPPDHPQELISAAHEELLPEGLQAAHLALPLPELVRHLYDYLAVLGRQPELRSHHGSHQVEDLLGGPRQLHLLGLGEGRLQQLFWNIAPQLFLKLSGAKLLEVLEDIGQVARCQLSQLLFNRAVIVLPAELCLRLVQHAALVEGALADLDKTDPRSLLAARDGVEDGSSSSEFGQQGGVNYDESFLKAVYQSRWQHITVRNNNPKVQLAHFFQVFGPFLASLFLAFFAGDWRRPWNFVLQAEVLHLVEDLPLPQRALSHHLQFGISFVKLAKRGVSYFSGAEEDDVIFFAN